MATLPEILEIISYTALAMAGGLARYFDGVNRNDASVKPPALASHIFVSAFAGYMFALVANRTQPEWAVIAAGLGGYFGTQALELLREVIMKRLNGK